MQGAELLATTRSPTVQLVTLRPIATISPAASCPNNVGGFSIRAWPPRRHTLRSVPQVVAAATRMTTSPAAGVGSATVSNRRSSCPYSNAANKAFPCTQPGYPNHLTRLRTAESRQVFPSPLTTEDSL